MIYHAEVDFYSCAQRLCPRPPRWIICRPQRHVGVDDSRNAGKADEDPETEETRRCYALFAWEGQLPNDRDWEKQVEDVGRGIQEAVDEDEYASVDTGVMVGWIDRPIST